MKRKYEKRDLYKEVTQRFIDALKNGAPPWIKPWSDSVSNMLADQSTLRPAGNIPESTFRFCGQQLQQPAIREIAG